MTQLSKGQACIQITSALKQENNDGPVCHQTDLND